MSTSTPGVLTLKPHVARAAANILVRIQVKGVPNVHKSRMQRLLASQLDDFDKERVALLEEHSNKDADGKPVVLNPGEPNATYDITDQKAWNAAFAKLQNEFLIEIGVSDPTHAKAIEISNDLLLKNCPELREDETILLVDIVDAFEAALKKPQSEEAKTESPKAE